MKNNKVFQLSIVELAKIISGQAIINPTREIILNQVSTDTRENCKDKIFFCFKGKKYNPHNLIDKIINKEVSCIVVDEEISQKYFLKLKDKNIGLITVKNTIIAHFILASHYFNQYKKNIQSIAITGSVGKTSVCQSTNAIMEAYYPNAVVSTYQNTNNIIGVAKNLFRINKKTIWLILELGTSSKNEIPFICQHLQFDFTYINNIYDCHLGNFSSFNELKDEKLSIINKQKNKNAIHFLSNELLSTYKKEISPNKNIANLDKIVKVKILKQGLLGTKFSIIWNDEEKKSTIIKSPFFTKEQIQNLRLALAIVNHLGLNKKIAYNTIKKINTIKQRMELIKFDKLTILDDSYNASFHSFQSAFNFIKIVQNEFSRLIFVLGDIAELGKISQDIHDKLIKILEQNSFKNFFIFTKGVYFAHSLKNSKLNFFHSNDNKQLVNKLRDLAKKKSLIYLKGSNDKQLKVIVKNLIENK